jgi:hypothetical protein
MLPAQCQLCLQGLCLVEVDAADRPVVLLKAIYQGAHAVVPQLDGRRVQ